MVRGFHVQRGPLGIWGRGPTQTARMDFEVVERKGAGHPDSVCDSLADAVSRSLSGYYLQHFGRILHHNVDKILLAGGSSAPKFGGGQITRPIRIFLAGRATHSVRGKEIPVADLAIAASRQWLTQQFPGLSATKIELECVIRPGSSELVDLSLRLGRDHVPLARV
jgi:S-adenosylmethionine synthetase